MTRAETLDAGAHLDEGALVRRLDGELDAGEAGGVEAHLAGCAHCRAELDGIDALARRFSRALPYLDPAPATTGRPIAASHLRPYRAAPSGFASPIWRAAAALALVAGLALAIAPVRAWIGERLGLSAGQPAADATARHDAAPVDATAREVRVAFVPTGENFRVLLAAPQPEGALRLEAALGDTARAEVLGADRADLLVLPDGIGIQNHAFSTADYRVVVPRYLAEIEVRVAGRSVWSGSPADLPATGTRIDLTLDRSPSDR